VRCKKKKKGGAQETEWEENSTKTTSGEKLQSQAKKSPGLRTGNDKGCARPKKKKIKRARGGTKKLPGKKIQQRGQPMRGEKWSEFRRPNKRKPGGRGKKGPSETKELVCGSRGF